MIRRQSYLERLIHSMRNDEIKVITGIRKCGKSVLLFELFYQYLLEQGVKEDEIIRVRLDDRRGCLLRNPIAMCTYISDILQQNPNKSFFLFIDEVQMTTKIVKNDRLGIAVTLFDMLNELRIYKNLDVYVIGSNSKGPSGDVLTEYKGHATRIHVHPLSFEEYYTCVGGDERKALDEYMLYGGMPRILTLTDNQDKKNYLSSLFEEVYYEDIVKRNHLERDDIMNNTLDYLASQTGSLTNPNNIANTLSGVRKEADTRNEANSTRETNTKKEKVNPTLISNYIQHAVDAFLIHMAKRYDVKAKTHLNYPNKYYYTDIGLRNARLNYRQYEPGRIIENIVYNELIRRGYSVDVGVVVDRSSGKNLQKEISFVVNHGDRRTYIQSTLRLETEANESPELVSLRLAKDSFRKVIIRMDIPHHFFDDNGILHCNLIDFLLNRVELF